jgi:hypothetical protein
MLVIEGFGQICTDLAEQIYARRRENRSPLRRHRCHAGIPQAQRLDRSQLDFKVSSSKVSLSDTLKIGRARSQKQHSG